MQLPGAGLPLPTGIGAFGYWLLIVTWEKWVLLENN